MKVSKKKETEILEIISYLSQIKIHLKSIQSDWNKWKTEFQGSKTK
jgi:hypothetical protein